MKGKGKRKSNSKEKGKKSSSSSNINMIETPNSTTNWYQYYCDKCGGMFTSEMELDHHDKTDH